MDFYAWVCIRGERHICHIEEYSQEEKTCCIRIGKHILDDIKFSQLTPAYSKSLPWER